MSEAYWIDSSASGVDALLGRVGARREWVEEAHWLLPTPANPIEDSAATGFCWPVRPPLDHALLHLLGQALASGERNVLLLGQSDGNAALLAGPKAVGRYNLSPKARLSARFTHTGADFAGWLATLPARLETSGQDPSDVAWLAVDRQPGRQAAFPRAGWLESPEPLLRRIDELIRRLAESHSPAGLLFSLPEHGPWLATLVERV